MMAPDITRPGSRPMVIGEAAKATLDAARPPALVAASQPDQVFSTRFALAPQALWQQLQHSRFVAGYLGAQLPEALLQPGQMLEGRDALGRPLHLSVSDAQPPCSLSLRLQGAEGDRLLQLAVDAQGSGCRLTVLHQSLPHHGGLPAGDGAAHGDAVSRLLARPPAAALVAARIGTAQALQLALAYLADSALAMQQLLEAMAPDQGYAKPAPDRFSLVEQIWHLADIEELGWAQRLPRVLTEAQPVLAGVDGDRLALERRYQQRPWRAAARRFIAQRRRSLAALAKFDDTVLERPLAFSGATVDAGTLLAAMLAHDHEHRLEMATLWAQERAR